MVAFSGWKAVDHLIGGADQYDIRLILLSFPFGLGVIYKCVGEGGKRKTKCYNPAKS